MVAPAPRRSTRPSSTTHPPQQSASSTSSQSRPIGRLFCARTGQTRVRRIFPLYRIHGAMRSRAARWCLHGPGIGSTGERIARDRPPPPPPGGSAPPRAVDTPPRLRAKRVGFYALMHYGARPRRCWAARGYMGGVSYADLCGFYPHAVSLWRFTHARPTLVHSWYAGCAK